MLIKPFDKAQLQGLREGLQQDLNKILNANAESKKKLDRLSTPEALKRYTNEALAAMRREAMQDESKTVRDIVQTLPQFKEMIELQTKYWEEDFWRDWPLYGQPPAIRLNDDAILLSSEKAIQFMANNSVSSNQQLMENTGRLWLVQELQLLDAEQFLKVIQIAEESGNACMIYIAKLIAGNRAFNSEAEKSRVSAELYNAAKNLKLPARDECLDILESCSELVADIESAWMALSTGEQDIRSRVRPIKEERRAKEAARKAALEAKQKELEAMEENMLLRGRA